MMMKHFRLEQTVVFPCIRQMEQRGVFPRLTGAAMDHPIRVLEREHRVFEDVLKELQQLGNDCRQELENCADFWGLMSTIRRLNVVVRRNDFVEGRRRLLYSFCCGISPLPLYSAP
jgi:iron-sulfur cluster repair protein YtfE (RIC family)